MIELNVDSLVENVNASPTFQEQARWFDGSILFEFGDRQLWLKIYNGEIIDTRNRMPPLGYTFKVTGPEERWREYFDGKRKFADLLNVGEIIEAGIWFEGDMMEARRMHEPTYLLVEHLKGVIHR